MPGDFQGVFFCSIVYRKTNSNKGHKQLKRAYDILEDEFDGPIFLRLDVVDYSENATSHVRVDDYKDVGIRIEYHPVDGLLSLADDLGLFYDQQVIVKARQSVMERKKRAGLAMARRMELQARKKQQSQAELSDFAMLLQQAIQVEGQDFVPGDFRGVFFENMVIGTET